MKRIFILLLVLLIFNNTAISNHDYSLLLNYTHTDAISKLNNYRNVNTLGTITLGVEYGTNTGIAVLNWAYSPIQNSLLNYFTIYKRIDNTTWTILADSVANVLYNDTIEDGLCDVYIDYKIQTIGVLGDTIVSNIAGKTFTESRLPDKPVLDSVSINANHNVVLGWDSVSSPDVAGIIIYRKVGNSWPDSTTIIIPYTTYYEDVTQYPCANENIQYAIASVDNCGNKSPKTELTAQRPIFLHNVETNLCSGINSLTWEPYLNAILPFNKYEIWSSKNNGAFTLIDTVASINSFYNHAGVDNATDYSYFVRAVFGESNYTSTSCIKSIRTGNFIKPDSIYVADADVLPNNNIELTLDVDLKPTNCTWEIYRSDAGGGSPTLLTSFTRNQIVTSPYMYIDETADGSTGFYTFSVNVVDSCGATDLQSNTVKTIFLEGQHLSDVENHLSWNLFKGWDSDVGKYYIFRMLGDVVPSQPIDSTDAQTTEYIDDISSVAANETKFSYWVQASEQQLNVYGYKEKSNSNIINLFKKTNFYFPNAFRPTGIDNVFKPVSVGFGGTDYLFQIYNRWGQLIFESREYNKGWDGKYKGNLSPQGTYIYRLVYKNVFGVTRQQRGSVMLIY